MVEKRPALGRGLSALIPGVPTASSARETPAEVDLDLLQPNRYQPRLQFDEAGLEELAQSIRANGVIQPILVRRHDKHYEIIAGERRWRAAQRAGLLRVPVVIRDVPDEKLLQVALIENIQRENLNPIDEASAYRRLMEEFHLTQEDLASAVGKDRSTVANILRLLRLPEAVRSSVASGALSMGHARALLALEREEDQIATATQVIDRGFSVRDTELLVKHVADRLAGRTAEKPCAGKINPARVSSVTRIAAARQGSKAKNGLRPAPASRRISETVCQRNSGSWRRTGVQAGGSKLRALTIAIKSRITRCHPA